MEAYRSLRRRGSHSFRTGCLEPAIPLHPGLCKCTLHQPKRNRWGRLDLLPALLLALTSWTSASGSGRLSPGEMAHRIHCTEGSMVPTDGLEAACNKMCLVSAWNRPPRLCRLKLLLVATSAELLLLSNERCALLRLENLRKLTPCSHSSSQ